MRPPWSESAPLLAAHHPTLAPVDLRRRGPFRSPPMPAARFALFRDLEPTTKPMVFDTLRDLALHIERRRDGRPLDLEDVEGVEFRGSPDLHLAVRVWTLDMANDRDACLGYAWLDDRGRETLDPALRAVRTHRDRRAA